MTIFKDKAQAVANMRSDRLLLAGRTHFPGVDLSDDYIYEKLLAAEAEVAGRLRVFLEPTIVLPNQYNEHEIESLPEDAVYVTEPAYDYDPDFFHGNRWGYIVTRESPVIEVDYIELVYPAPTQSFYKIPTEWIRVDNQYGHIRLVPATQSFSAPLGAFLMQAIGGGRTIPHMIRMRYTAGLQDIETRWPHVLDLVKRQASLLIMSEAFLPQSESISADGLSQSVGVDINKYHDMNDRAFSSLRSEIHGVRNIVIA